MSRSDKRKKLMEQQKRQKDATKANKILAEKIEKDFVLDYENMTEFDGIRAYVLIKLQELIDIFSMDKKDTKLIDKKVSELTKIILKNGNRCYLNAIRKSKNLLNYDELNKQLLLKEANIKSNKYFLNNTEKVLVSTQLTSIATESVMSLITGEKIDYAGNSVRINLAIKLLKEGLEDRKIDIINMYVGYNDTIEYYTIDYSDSDESYILNNACDDDIIIKDTILVKWNTIDNLYNAYVASGVTYDLFTEHSKRILATVNEDEENYNNRKVARELIAYDSIYLNYAIVLETELRRLISLERKIEKNITLIDMINYLKDGVIEEITEDRINAIDKIRRKRNDAAHGRSVSFKDFQLLKKELIDKKLLFTIEKALEKRINN